MFFPIVRFAVMSDLHYCEGQTRQRENFKKAMETVYTYSDSQEYKGLDALYVVGDFTDTGHTEQMEMFAHDCAAYVRTSTKTVITLANHELHYVPDMKVAIDDFQRIFHMDVDRHEVINGYHFISVSTTIAAGPWHDSFDCQKREFLKTELDKATAEDKTKPVFVFHHPGQSSTVAGGVFGNKQIYQILSQYPQIIDFSGHSHMPVNSPLEIHQGDYTSVSTGSLFNISVFNKCVFEKINQQLFRATDCAHMLLVEADANGEVRIKKLDVMTGRFFDPDHVIKNGSDRSGYVYTKKRATTASKPYFPDGNFRAVCENDQIKVTFPRALCAEERIFFYNIVIKEGEKTVVDWSAASDFPMFCQKDGYTVQVPLPQEQKNLSDLTVALRAVGFWENVSDPVQMKIESGSADAR